MKELNLPFDRKEKDHIRRKFFNEKAEVWDTFSINDKKKMEYITDLFEIKENFNILDVGTGTGVMIPFYLKKLKNGNVTGLDYSEKMIAIAKKKNPESSTVSYQIADVYNLEPEEKYDLVVCYSCFPHFYDPMNALKRLSGVLKKGGRLAIAHSSSRNNINNIHHSGDDAVCNDYLPDMEDMKKMFTILGLSPEFVRDDSEYYIIIARK